MLQEIKPVAVKHIPEHKDMEYGKVYISEEYETSSHLCPCGCGELVVTPGSHIIEGKDYGWITTFVNGELTLHPSVGNFQLPCKSHYFIVKNKINWC